MQTRKNALMVPLVALAAVTGPSTVAQASSQPPHTRAVAAAIVDAHLAQRAQRPARIAVRGRAVAARQVLRGLYVPRPYRKG